MDRKPSTKLKHLQPLIAVIVTFVLCIAISIFSLKSGCFIIFQNLFYIPIVISCFYYQKRGFIFSIIVACIYFLLILLFTKESSIILQAIVRVFIFILIAGVITFMSLLRKQMKELRITSLYNRSLIEASLDPLVTLRSDGTIMDVNAATENITGYTHAELIGTEFSKYFTEPEKAEATYQDVFQGGPIRNHLLKLQHRDGHVTSVLFNVSIYRDEQGQYVGVFAAARDITNLIQAEETLRENEKKYRLLADNLHDVIFILDMNLNYTYISPSVRILRGYEPEEVLQQTPAETLTPTSMDLAMKALSEIMELEKSGRREEIPTSRTLQLEMRRKDKTTVMTEVKFSLIRDENQKVVGIMGVTRDITERKQAEEELQKTLESLRNAVGATIQVMVSAVEMRDPYTAGHQIRVADLAISIAMEMGLPQNKIDGIRMAGSIHDIGKLSIPAEILSKPTKLTNTEFSLIKEHSLSGYEMLKNVESPWPLAEIVYQHHERMNGSGYPRNLKGDEIIMEARIMAVADVVESMASHRPYRPALGIDVALEEIEKNRGILYDNAVSDACLRLFREKDYRLT